MSSILAEEFIEEIKKGIHARKKHHKFDAYFDLPDCITTKQIKEIKKIIELENVICRLYTPKRLQIFWEFTPKRNLLEYMSNSPLLIDIDEQLEFFKLFE